MTNRFALLESTLAGGRAARSRPAKSHAKPALPRAAKPQPAPARVQRQTQPAAPIASAPPPVPAPRSRGLRLKVNQWRGGRPAIAFNAVDHIIPGTFRPIAQTKTMGCWATVYTMLLSWRRQQSMSIETALGEVGSRWLDIYNANSGLVGAEKPDFLAAAGLVAEPPQSFSVDGWEQLLRNYGPVWITADEKPGQPGGIHGRVIVGIRGDGTPEGTSFSIVDPAGARRYSETVAAFIPKYEAEVRETGYMRVQVVHWQSDARSEMRALSFGRRPTAPRAYGRAADGELAATVARLRAQGVADEDIRGFLAGLGASAAMSRPRALDAGGVRVTLPGGYVLDNWKGELLLAAISVAMPPIGAFMPLLRAAANRFGVTIGMGPAVTGGVGGGAGFGAGVLFAPGNRVGFYGSMGAVVGAIASIGLTMQVTIVRGGPEVFGGSGVAVTVGGGEGVVGAASALLSSDGRFIGVTFEMGVGAGLSPIEFFAQFQYTPTTFALAYSDDDIPLAPNQGGMSIGTSALQNGDIILSTSSGLVSGGIRLFSGAPVSHAALYIGNGQVVEAVGEGVVLHQLEEALSDDVVAVAFRHPGLGETQALMVRDFAGRQLGSKYNYWGIVRQAPFSVDRRLCELLPERARERCQRGLARIYLGTPSNDAFFCSQLIAAAYAHAGVPLAAAEPQWLSPGDLARMRPEDVPAFPIARPLEYVGHLKA
jgi:cell wall-associated NlpC family hydrolase